MNKVGLSRPHYSIARLHQQDLIDAKVEALELRLLDQLHKSALARCDLIEGAFCRQLNISLVDTIYSMHRRNAIRLYRSRVSM